MTLLVAPVSVGELLDKIAILRIKAERIKVVHKRLNINMELSALEAVAACVERTPALLALEGELRAVNEVLWDVEDALREHEARGDFGAGFVGLARAVYRTNDRRAALKRAVNDLAGSVLVEEKSYGEGAGR